MASNPLAPRPIAADSHVSSERRDSTVKESQLLGSLLLDAEGDHERVCASVGANLRSFKF